MKPDLYIRADGSTQMGLGHLFRCLSLGQILKETYRVVFFSRLLPADFEKELMIQDFEFNRIIDEDSFFDRLSPGKIVVLDGYQFDSDYQKKIKKRGCKLACIDDVHDKEFFADLVINHAPGVSKSDYNARPYTRFALGLEYALLRPAFLNLSEFKLIKKIPGSVLICFGGSDVKNLTEKILHQILSYKNFKKIIVVTGSAYTGKEKLLSFIENHDRIEHYHAADETLMMKLMLESQAAIVPASGILMEAIASGIRTVSGMYTENQSNIYSGFKQLNAIADAGTFKPDEIERAIKKLGSLKNIKLIDGKSPERIRQLFAGL